MNRLHSIVRRLHCTGTHHRFAVDALPLVQTDAGKRLAGWLLRYYRSYLAGAMDPDLRFRDFHNHILHVNEGFWGGAPRVAHQWYSRLQKHLRAERFRQAAHAAGVLSHYVSDVIQPLHTASTDRETLVHRPLELSISESYDRIFDVWQSSDVAVTIQLSNRPEWLGSMMMHSAQFAGQRFDSLVKRYRFQEGVEEPKKGLDGQSIRILSELFGLTVTGWASIIDRAAEESEAYSHCAMPSPRLNLVVPSALATAPAAAWRRKVQVAKEYLAVSELAKEYFRTGKLTRHLPAEVDIKRRVIAVYHREKAYRARRDQSRAA